MNNCLIKVEHLEKHLRSADKVFVLSDVTFDLNGAEIIALAGLNGAGKTTLIKLILGLLKPNNGFVKYNPKLNNGGSLKIGYLPESFGSSRYEMTVKSFLKLFCGLNGISGNRFDYEVDKTLDTVGLTGNTNQPVNKLSKGMKTRLGLAQSLLGNPSLLVLDEPTDGLDPQGRKNVLELLKQLKNNERAILISSHVLTELERVCDRILIIDQGKLLFDGYLEKYINATTHPSFQYNNDNNISGSTKNNVISGVYNSVDELFFNTIKKEK